ncbi:hypothetical protein AAG614_13200 [Citromicrobium bathyomarinum]
MRLFLISGAAALVGLAAPASAQYYAPRPAYAPAPARTSPPLPPSYDRGDWVRECRAYLRDRRRRGETGGVVGGLIGGAGGALLGNELADDGSRLAGSLIGGGIGGLAGVAIGTAIGLAGRDDERRDCRAWLDHYERAAAERAADGYGYDYDYGYDQGGYGYGYDDGYAYAAPGYGGGGYAYASGGGYSGGYAGGYAGGGYATGVVVVVEHQRGERYVPVIREEIIEETYETTEYETVRERVTDYVPLPVEHPQPRGDKRIRYTKQR